MICYNTPDILKQ